MFSPTSFFILFIAEAAPRLCWFKACLLETKSETDNHLMLLRHTIRKAALRIFTLCKRWYLTNRCVALRGSSCLALLVLAWQFLSFSSLSGCRSSSTWTRTPSRSDWSFSSSKTKDQVSGCCGAFFSRELDWLVHCWKDPLKWKTEWKQNQQTDKTQVSWIATKDLKRITSGL